MSRHAACGTEAQKSLQRLGRVGEISDLVDPVLYLEHVAFVTGATLHVDGGYTAGR